MEMTAMQQALAKADDFAAKVVKHLGRKSGEVLHLRQLLDQSSKRLAQLQSALDALRQDRHRLANEAMRVMKLESALKQVTAERDRLKAERDGVLPGLAEWVPGAGM